MSPIIFMADGPQPEKITGPIVVCEYCMQPCRAGDGSTMRWFWNFLTRQESQWSFVHEDCLEDWEEHIVPRLALEGEGWLPLESRADQFIERLADNHANLRDNPELVRDVPYGWEMP